MANSVSSGIPAALADEIQIFIFDILPDLDLLLPGWGP